MMGQRVMHHSNMGVAHIVGYVGAQYGGVPQVVMALFRRMVDLGLNVSLWATGTAHDAERSYGPGSRVNVYERCWPKCWFRAPDLVRDLQAARDVNLFHLHGVWTHVQQATSRLARKRGTPYMITPHGVLLPRHVHSKGLKKHVYLSLVGKEMLRSSACLHAITPAEVEGFRHAGYDGPVTVIPNGVDTPEYDVPLAREEADTYWPILRGRRVVLFLSRLSPEKGLDEFIPAFADTAKREAYDDTLLVLAGSGTDHYCNEVTAIREKYRIQDRVIMVGFVQGREKELLMARADVYTLPSYCEGLSMSVLENLAVGTPALITTGCNFPELVRSGAGICCSPDSTSLAEGLRRLLDMSAPERREMGQRGRALVKRDYAWNTIVEKLIVVYRCILAGKPVPLHPEPKWMEPV